MSKIEEKEVVVETPGPVKGNLVSKLDHPVYLSYKGEGVTLSPRGTINEVERDQLGALPKGIIFIGQ